MFEQQVDPMGLSQLYHHCPKSSFLIKRSDSIKCANFQMISTNMMSYQMNKHATETALEAKYMKYKSCKSTKVSPGSKVSNDIDALWWLCQWTNIAKRRPLKAIWLKSWRLCQSTKMCAGKSKLGFFKNEDYFGQLCKVSSDFVKIFKLSKFQAEKKKW